jgi:hypothetical protein
VLQLYDLQLDPQPVRRNRKISEVEILNRSGEPEDGHALRTGHSLLQYLHALLHQLRCEVGDASDVTSWSRQTADQPELVGIST